MVIRDKIGGYKEKRHCRVNMIKEQRISIYEHRIFALQYIVYRCTFRTIRFMQYVQRRSFR